jgi:hypothetical protein
MSSLQLLHLHSGLFDPAQSRQIRRPFRPFAIGVQLRPCIGYLGFQAQQ